MQYALTLVQMTVCWASSSMRCRWLHQLTAAFLFNKRPVGINCVRIVHFPMFFIEGPRCVCATRIRNAGHGLVGYIILWDIFSWFSFVFLVFDVLNHLIGSEIVTQILSAVFDDCRYGCVLDESFPGKTEADTTSSVASGDLKILFLAVNAATS